jgi:uncharacterized membrane protein YsdA (DUF1294 family)
VVEGLLVPATYVGAINVISFALMVLDKKLAVAHRRRISEATLLFVAFLGGGLGGKLAQKLFRHKTQKQPFKLFLNLWFFTSLLVAIALVIPQGRYALMTYIQQFP